MLLTAGGIRTQSDCWRDTNSVRLLKGYEPKATIVTLRSSKLEGYEPSPLAEGIRPQTPGVPPISHLAYRLVLGWNASASSVKIGTIQRRLAWPLRKDDTAKIENVSLFIANVLVA